MGRLVQIEAGDADGESAAIEAGVVDGDDAQQWRRADVSINGVVVLHLYGAAGESTGATETVRSHPETAVTP